jgi:hypothetical protein
MSPDVSENPTVDTTSASAVHVESDRVPVDDVLMSRLRDLGELTLNWWGPGTRGPGPVALQHASEIAPQLAQTNRRVSLGADGDGSIIIEWTNAMISCIVEIQADGGMYLFADNAVSDTYQTSTGKFDAETVIRFVETGKIASVAERPASSTTSY